MEGIRGQVRLSMLCVFQGKVAQNLEKVSRTPGCGRSLLWGELSQVSASQDIYLMVLNLCSIKNLLMTNSVSVFFRETAKCSRQNS